MSTVPTVHTVATYEGARDAFRQKQLRQALYDAGEVVMADVLVNLHGDAHRSRRRLENRLFRRDGGRTGLERPRILHFCSSPRAECADTEASAASRLKPGSGARCKTPVGDTRLSLSILLSARSAEPVDSTS